MAKAFKGSKRIAKKLNRRYFTEPWYKATLDYLLKCKPGDIIHACTGYNHRITAIEVVPIGRRKTWIVEEVRVTDEDGRWHYFPGGGCIQLPQTQAEIEEYQRGWDHPEGWKMLEAWKFQQLAEDILKLRKGEHSVDENGFPIKNTNSGLPLEDLVLLLKNQINEGQPEHR